MITVYKRTKQIIATALLAVLVMGVGCKKGTFDINSPNPNALSPSVVPPQYYLSSALAQTAQLMYTGPNGFATNGDLLNTWMGYWSASGGYTPSPIVVLYQLNSGVGTGNWDAAYLNLGNYNAMQKLAAADPNLGYYQAIGMIMKSFVFQRVVDLYNNAPYSEAFNTANTTPKYDKGSDIYDSLINNVNAAISLIKTTAANANAVDVESKYDVMFGGDMDMWTKFANTLKLKLLMRLTAVNESKVKAGLSGLSTDDFLGEGEDASVNPGYSTASSAQENPLYLDIALNASGQSGTNNVYWRANTYAINFYKNNNDPRIAYFYQPNKAGEYRGRKIGSVASGEGNDLISAVNGPGVAKSATQDAVIIGAYESLLLQAEAAQRGYISGSASALYKAGVEQSFILLGGTAAQADTYISQAGNNKVNFDGSTNKIATIITQVWAASMAFDPLEAYSDWRRTGYPADMDVSDYPGSQATHIPYRLPYPTSETSYNSANANGQGNVDYLTSKIFWQP